MSPNDTHPGQEMLANAEQTALDDLTTLVQAGSEALEEGDLRAALEKYEEVVNAFPDRPEGHNNLGALYSSLGDLEKAEACFDKVLTILPGNTNVLYNRGLIRARREKFEEAWRDFAGVLAQNPEDPDAHNNLGVAAFLSGEPELARQHFQSALTHFPDHANALVNLCDLECSEGNHNAAAQLCENHLEGGETPQVRMKLVEIRADACRASLDEAGRAAENALAVDGGNREIRQQLGRLLAARAALDPIQE